MEIFKLIDVIENKLLKYKPIEEIYYVERHNFSLENIDGMVDTIEKNWNKIFDNFINILKVLQEYINDDDYLENSENYINDEIFDLNEAVSGLTLEVLCFSEKEKIAKITLLLNLYACCVVPQGNPSRLLDNGVLDYSPKTNYYFRGEDNYEYSLIPSIYRNKQFKDSGETLNFISFLFPYYQNRGLIRKYNEFQNYKEIDYCFCSLMQHAGCNSPLLDITKNSKIAVSFASNTEQNIDGSLYVFSNIKEINEIEDVKSLSIFAINKKLDYLTIIRRTPILLCGIDKFDVEFKILTYQTNDRMKFQEGAFLYINKCIIINNKILLPISNKKIKKYRITSDYKKNYQVLVEPRYQYKYLMNPYSYLKDGIDEK